MKLIGYSRRRLDSIADVQAVFAAVTTAFGNEGFYFSVPAESASERDVSFSLELGVSKLKRSSALGFFKKNVVGVVIDNQAFNGGYLVYPSALVQIEAMDDNPASNLGVEEWLSLAETLTAATGLDLAFVMGTKETLGDYYRTPLGCGIGLIKVFWINCFGSAYSALIPEQAGSAHFFKCEEFGGVGKAFVSAPSHESYLGASAELLALQKRELGEELFNRLPPEKARRGGSYWLLDPRVVLGFFALLYRQKLTNWHRYQAKVVPACFHR